MQHPAGVYGAAGCRAALLVTAVVAAHLFCAAASEFVQHAGTVAAHESASFLHTELEQVQKTQQSTCTASCSRTGAGCALLPRFRGYRPSAWEKEWSALATPVVAASKGALCRMVSVYPERVQTWLDAVQQATTVLGGSSDATSLETWAASDHAVFSAFEWEDPCNGEIITAPIEPLVGHFRHPLGPQCNRTTKLHIESREYLLMSGLTPQQFQRLYPGRRLLMDFGSSSWPDSLGWLVDRYGERGVGFFDEIWAWEVRPANHAQYWSKVPANQRHRLHFFNVPVGGDVNAVDHPVQWLKQVVKPGDFLAIKLDIDHSPTEMAFMHAIKSDAELRGLISEMMFEMHYEHIDMAYGRFRAQGPGVTWRNVFDFFQGLRNDGLRLHYWP